jgi:muramidase (phage lysozyme)
MSDPNVTPDGIIESEDLDAAPLAAPKADEPVTETAAPPAEPTPETDEATTENSSYPPYDPGGRRDPFVPLTPPDEKPGAEPPGDGVLFRKDADAFVGPPPPPAPPRAAGARRAQDAEDEDGPLRTVYNRAAADEAPMSLNLLVQSAFKNIGIWLDLLFSLFRDPEEYAFKLKKYGYDQPENVPEEMRPHIETLEEARRDPNHRYRSMDVKDIIREEFRAELNSLTVEGQTKYTPAQVDYIVDVAAAIASRESNGDYNVVNGPDGGRKFNFNFTDMTIDEVIAWQKQDELTNGDEMSAAVGRYQIIRKTLEGLKRDMHLTGNELFDEHTQDLMALHLMQEKGLDAYLSGNPDMPKEIFMNGLKDVWEGFQPSDVTHLDTPLRTPSPGGVR